MAFVPGYKHDIFVSYAHVNNQVVPGADEGWVTILVKWLGIGLSQKLGRKEHRGQQRNLGDGALELALGKEGQDGQDDPRAEDVGKDDEQNGKKPSCIHESSLTEVYHTFWNTPNRPAPAREQATRRQRCPFGQNRLCGSRLRRLRQVGRSCKAPDCDPA